MRQIILTLCYLISFSAWGSEDSERWWGGYEAALRAGSVSSAVEYLKHLQTHFDSEIQARDNAKAIKWFLTTGGKYGFATKADGAYRTATADEKATMEESFLFALHFGDFHVFRDVSAPIVPALKGHFIALQTVACAYDMLIAPNPALLAPPEVYNPTPDTSVFTYTLDEAGAEPMLCRYVYNVSTQDIQIKEWEHAILKNIQRFAQVRRDLGRSGPFTAPSGEALPAVLNYKDFTSMLDYAGGETFKTRVHALRTALQSNVPSLSFSPFWFPYEEQPRYTNSIIQQVADVRKWIRTGRTREGVYMVKREKSSDGVIFSSDLILHYLPPKDSPLYDFVLAFTSAYAGR